MRNVPKPTVHPLFSELCGRLRTRPLVMGILNVTPDSFSDGGLWLDPDAALRHALDMADAGADIVDVGGESTRPGAPGVALDEELRRVLPVLLALRRERPNLPLSIDTQKAEVAARAVEAGACLVNDVSALRADPGMLAALASGNAGACLMHRLEAPKDAAWSPNEPGRYGERGVTAVVAGFLSERMAACAAAGVGPERLWLDPGLGFGKSVADNLRLLRELPGLAALGRPLLVGPSRKSFIGAVGGGLPVEERLPGTLAACAVALWQGAAALRVHDVREAAQAARMVQAIRTA